MINNANKALGYTEVYYNYRSNKFFTDAVGNQFALLNLSLDDDGGGGSGIQPGDNVSLLTNDASYVSTGASITLFNNDAGYLTSEASTLDDVTDRGSSTTNDITVGRLNANKVGLPVVSALPTSGFQFGDMCALNTDNKAYFYDGTSWKKVYLTGTTPDPGDPDTDWDKVLLRCTFNTNLNDVSDSGHAASGDAIITGSPSKYGGGALGINLGRFAAWSMPSDFLDSEFTLEAWLFFDSVATNSTISIFGKGAILFECSSISSNSDSSEFNFSIRNTNSGVNDSVGSLIQLNLKEWYYVTYCRNSESGEVVFYINGVRQGSTFVMNGFQDNNQATFNIGIDGQNQDTFFDDLRVSTFERYTSDFTPPTGELPTSG